MGVTRGAKASFSQRWEEEKEDDVIWNLFLNLKFELWQIKKKKRASATIQVALVSHSSS